MTLRRRTGSVSVIALYDYLVYSLSPFTSYTTKQKQKQGIAKHSKTIMYRGEFVKIYIQHIDTLQVKILAGILLYIIVTKHSLVPREVLPHHP